MHIKTIIISLSIAISCHTGSAQLCGNEVSELPAAYGDLIVDLQKEPKSFDQHTFGISFHIVESVAGEGGLTTDELIEEINGLNNAFFDVGLQFFMCGSQRFVQGLNSYDFSTGAQLNRANHVENTINVFYVNELTTSNLDALCGFAIFPWSGKQEDRYAVVEKSCAGQGKVLAHELGHYFGLLHTHSTFNGVELVNRSNCDDAGDLLCDTPADYNLSFGGLTACTYTGQFVDPLGDPYMPNPSNIMSYAPPPCLRRFSDQQAEVSQFYAGLLSGSIKNECPDFPDLLIAGSDQSLSVKSGEVFQLPIEIDQVGLSEALQVSLYIYLSDDPSLLGTIIHRQEITLDVQGGSMDQIIEVQFPLTRGSGNYVLTAILDADFEILEQTKANNQVKLDLNVDNSAFEDLVIFPNPAIDALRFFIRSPRDQGKFTVRFADLSGRVLKEIRGFKNEVEFLNEFDVSDLPRGPIAVSVEFELAGEAYPFLIYKR